MHAPARPYGWTGCKRNADSDVNEASWTWGQGRGQKEWGRGRGPKFFLEAEATMYEAEARHVREQLSVYEHEDVLRSEHSFQ